MSRLVSSLKSARLSPRFQGRRLFLRNRLKTCPAAALFVKYVAKPLEPIVNSTGIWSMHMGNQKERTPHATQKNNQAARMNFEAYFCGPKKHTVCVFLPANLGKPHAERLEPARVRPKLLPTENRKLSAPAGIWTRVTDSKGRYTWPDYTTGAPLLKAQAEYNLCRINLTLPQIGF